MYAVSAWNDNGFQWLVTDPYNLRRTDYFPGLGWLLTRTLYKEQVSFLFAQCSMLRKNAPFCTPWRELAARAAIAAAPQMPRRCP